MIGCLRAIEGPFNAFPGQNEGENSGARVVEVTFWPHERNCCDEYDYVNRPSNMLRAMKYWMTVHLPVVREEGEAKCLLIDEIGLEGGGHSFAKEKRKGYFT